MQTETNTAEKTKDELKIEAFRRIVEDCQCETIDSVMVDLYSANTILAVFDNINEENQAKFMMMPVERMAEVAYKVTSK